MTDLEAARSKHTSQSELLRLLEFGSVSVRRAVASNLNASPEVLEKAAMMDQLETVLENEAFLHYALFSDNTWIKSTFELYQNPIYTPNVHRGYKNWGLAERHKFTSRVILLSPNLDFVSLDEAVRQVGVNELRKLSKNKKVREKITSLCNEALHDPHPSSSSEVEKETMYMYPFCLTTLLELLSLDFIDKKYFIKATNHFGIGRTWIDSNLCVRIAKKLVKEFRDPLTPQEEKVDIINCFSKWLLVCRANVYDSIAPVFWELKEEHIKNLLVPIYKKLTFVGKKYTKSNGENYVTMLDTQIKKFKSNLLLCIEKNTPKSMLLMSVSESKATEILNSYLDSYLDKN